MLNGTAGPQNHSILYYVNKNNPLIEGSSVNDSQFQNWEWAVNNWTGF